MSEAEEAARKAGRARTHVQLVRYILRDCPIELINKRLATHPGVVELDKYLAEFYLFPTEPNRTVS